MTRKELIENINTTLRRYLNATEYYGPDPQLSVNPVTLYVDLATDATRTAGLADSEEALEDAAAAQGDASEAATDFQARENPDYYPVSQFLKYTSGAPTVPDTAAVAALALSYIP